MALMQQEKLFLLMNWPKPFACEREYELPLMDFTIQKKRAIKKGVYRLRAIIVIHSIIRNSLMFF